MDQGVLLTSLETDFPSVRRALAEAPSLSSRQPWAELILSGRKRVELRRRTEPYRGWVWLHTGQTVEEPECARFGLGELFKGGFVGAFQLRDIVAFDAERWEEWRPMHLDRGRYHPDFFGWVIGKTARLQMPVVAPGSLGLFPIEASLRERLLAQKFVGES